jgi:hypothetical protein
VEQRLPLDWFPAAPLPSLSANVSGSEMLSSSISECVLGEEGGGGGGVLSVWLSLRRIEASETGF